MRLFRDFLLLKWAFHEKLSSKFLNIGEGERTNTYLLYTYHIDASTSLSSASRGIIGLSNTNITSTFDKNLPKSFCKMKMKVLLTNESSQLILLLNSFLVLTHHHTTHLYTIRTIRCVDRCSRRVERRNISLCSTMKQGLDKDSFVN